MNEIWNTNQIDKEKDLSEKFQSLVGKHIDFSQFLESSILYQGLEEKNSFIVKKVVFGSLESNKDIKQFMIASQFNMVYIVSSVTEVHSNNNGNEFKIYSQKSEGYTICYTLKVIEDGEKK